MKKDNPKILQHYLTPNADGQIGEYCIYFNNSFYKNDRMTCSVNVMNNEAEEYSVCEVLKGQFCDCYSKGISYQ